MGWGGLELKECVRACVRVREEGGRGMLGGYLFAFLIIYSIVVGDGNWI